MSLRPRRTLLTVLLALLLLGLLALPWPTRVVSSALLRPAQMLDLHAPGAARLQTPPPADGMQVAAGALLYQLEAPAPLFRRQALVSRIEALRWQTASAGIDPQGHGSLGMLEEALATAEAELASVEAELQLYAARAPFAGRLRDVDPELRVGHWVAAHEKIATLVQEDGAWLVETWLEAAALQRVAAGDEALFTLDAAAGPVIALRVAAIDADAAPVLHRAELAAQHGGHVLAREKGGKLVPEQAIHRVTLTPTEPQALQALAGHGWRGRLVIRGRATAPLAAFFRPKAPVPGRGSSL